MKIYSVIRTLQLVLSNIKLQNHRILIEFPKDRFLLQNSYRKTASHVIFSFTLISVI